MIILYWKLAKRVDLRWSQHRHTHTHTHTHTRWWCEKVDVLISLDIVLIALYIGEGSGTPLQYSCLENPMGRGAWWASVHGVAKSWTWLNVFSFTFHFHALEKEMATHSSTLAWRIPGIGDPGGLPSMGSHRVGHNWSDLASAAALYIYVCIKTLCFTSCIRAQSYLTQGKNHPAFLGVCDLQRIQGNIQLQINVNYSVL